MKPSEMAREAVAAYAKKSTHPEVINDLGESISRALERQNEKKPISDDGQLVLAKLTAMFLVAVDKAFELEDSGVSKAQAN